MRPGVVILGFVLGSAAAITFALFGTMIVFVALRADYPRLDSEIPSLWWSLFLFALLTAAAAASFYGLLRVKSWRKGAVAILLLGLGAIGWYHWPA